MDIWSTQVTTRRVDLNPRGDLNTRESIQNSPVYITPQVNIGTMAIWRTSPPNPSDFPIWAYHISEAGSIDELKLYRSLDDLMVGDGSIVWSTVAYQDLPIDLVSISAAFQQLADSDESTGWSSSDWFRAGVYYASTLKTDNKTECGCSQAECGCSSEI